MTIILSKNHDIYVDRFRESERDVQELRILIELKKKFPSLFQQDEDKS